MVILARGQNRYCCDLSRYDAPVLRPVAVLVVIGDLRQRRGEIRVEAGLLGREQRKEYVVSRLGGGRLVRGIAFYVERNHGRRVVRPDRVHGIEHRRVHHGHVTALAVDNSVARHGADGDRVPIGDDIRIGNLRHTQKCRRTRDQDQMQLVH